MASKAALFLATAGTVVANNSAEDNTKIHKPLKLEIRRALEGEEAPAPEEGWDKNRTRGLHLKIGSQFNVNSLMNGTYSVAIDFGNGNSFEFAETKEGPMVDLNYTDDDGSGIDLEYNPMSWSPFLIPSHFTTDGDKILVEAKTEGSEGDGAEGGDEGDEGDGDGGDSSTPEGGGSRRLQATDTSSSEEAATTGGEAATTASTTSEATPSAEESPTPDSTSSAASEEETKIDLVTPTSPNPNPAVEVTPTPEESPAEEGSTGEEGSGSEEPASSEGGDEASGDGGQGGSAPRETQATPDPSEEAATPEDSSDPTTDPAADPATDTTTDPTTDPTTDSTTDPTTDPSTDPSTDPTTTDETTPSSTSGTGSTTPTFSVTMRELIEREDKFVDFQKNSSSRMTMVEIPTFSLFINTKREPICLNSEIEDNQSQGTKQVLDFDYMNHGEDWAEKFSVCGNEQQSPINLISPVTQYGQSYLMFQWSSDLYIGEYYDQEDIFIGFNPDLHAVSATLSNINGYNGFTSQLGADLFGAPTKWDAYEINFHSGSEHLIDGKRYDLELQVYHKVAEDTVTSVTNNAGNARLLQETDPAAAASATATPQKERTRIQDMIEEETEFQEFDNAAVSVLFSIDAKREDVPPQTMAFLDEFFDSVETGLNQSEAVDVIPIEKLMRALDWSNRWVYKGSHSSPPCHQFVYWNVLHTVYPVHPDLVEKIRSFMPVIDVETVTSTEVPNDDESGNSTTVNTTTIKEVRLENWRKVSAGINKDVYFISSKAVALQMSAAAFLALAISSLL